MAITTAQKKQIINWVNSNVVRDEIIAHCVTATDTYCSLVNKGVKLNKDYIKSEVLVDDYLLTAKLPFVHSPSMNRYISAEILNKYGSLLDKKINEQLRTNNLQNDF